ncbi:MAG: GPP34 family phosphoprotein [Lentisphaerota bacterium]
MMLSFAEEIYLLALDDVTGKIVITSKEVVLNSVLIGAVLSELSFIGKIDNDAENLYILNTDATGSPVLDEVLDVLRKSGKNEVSLSRSLQALLPESKNIEQLVLKELIGKGILKQVNEKLFWFFPSRRYPIIDNVEVTDVERRLRNLVLSNEIPAPRDAVLVSLVNACGLFSEILSSRELRRCEGRIEEISKYDMVCQKINELIQQVQDFSNIPPFV